MTPLSPIQGECVVDLATAPDPQASILAGKGVVLRAVLTEQFNSWAVSSIIFQATAVDFASKWLLPIAKQTEPLLWLRLSIRSGQEVARAWEPCLLTYYQTLVLNDDSSATVLIQTADLLWKLDRGPKINNYSGTTAAMVTKIVQGNYPQNLKVAAEASGASYTLYQHAITDWAFLRSRVQPRTLNGQKHGGYQIYQRADAAGSPRIIFGTPDFPDVQPTVWDVQQSASSPVGKIMFCDRSRLNAAGLAGASVIPENPYQPAGTTTVNPSNANTALKFSDTPASASPTEGVLVARHASEVNSPADEMAALAQNAYADERLDVYRAEFDVAQVPTIRVGDFIQVRAGDAAWNGPYVIAHLVHEVTRGSLKTSVRGVRGDSTQQGGQALSVPTSSPDAAAPGSNSGTSGGQPPRSIPDTSTPAADNPASYSGKTAIPGDDGNPGSEIQLSDPNTPVPQQGTSGVLNPADFANTPKVPYGSGNPNAPYTPDPLPSGD